MKEGTRYTRAISIIVPVYKVEEYLPQCIDSVLNQTFTNFELILVDDGSPDRCGMICDEYANRDSRIVVIHQENGGVSAARNAALDWVLANSESRWITFVDSDDCIAPNYLSELHKYGTERNADVVVTGAQTFANDSELESAPCNIVRVYEQTGRACCEDIFKRQDFFMSSPWGKLFRRALFSDMRFPEGRQYEDLNLIPRILYQTSEVIVLRSWLYRYRQRDGSIIHSTFSMRRYDQIEAIDANIHFLREHGEDEMVKLASQYRQTHIAEFTLLAAGAHLLHQVPEEYKMPLWKAWYVTMTKTIRRGGLRFIFERIKRYFARLSHQ